MRSSCFLALACSCLAIGSAQAAPVNVASTGGTLVIATLGGLTAQATIKTHEAPIGKASDPKPATIESNCTYSKFPCSIVDRLDISVNGKGLFVPRSVFADLADLDKAEIKPAGGDWILVLSGGDGSERYILSVLFDEISVKRRTLSSGISPGQVLQETNYHQVVFGE